MTKALRLFLLASLLCCGLTFGLENWEEILDDSAVDTSHWINPNDMGFERNSQKVVKNVKSVKNDIHLKIQNVVKSDADSKSQLEDVSNPEIFLSSENQNDKQETSTKSGNTFLLYC